MDKYKINISDLAKQDIMRMKEYISNDLLEPVIAVNTTDAVLDAITTLEEMPDRIGLVKDERLAEKGIRPLHVKNYTVFFRVDASAKIVDVVRVVYSRRDWASLL